MILADPESRKEAKKVREALSCIGKIMDGACSASSRKSCFSISRLGNGIEMKGPFPVASEALWHMKGLFCKLFGIGSDMSNEIISQISKMAFVTSAACFVKCSRESVLFKTGDGKSSKVFASVWSEVAEGTTCKACPRRSSKRGCNRSCIFVTIGVFNDENSAKAYYVSKSI